MEGTKQYKIEQALMPVYYKKFQCIGGACQDTCCKEWRIEFDKKDYLRLRNVEGSPELREKMKTVVRRNRGPRAQGNHYARFELAGDHVTCPLQREDGLCGLQVECGHECLPKVCKVFPRCESLNVEAVEFALSPACEAVLGLLWDLPQGVDFMVEELPERKKSILNLREDAPMLAFAPLAKSVCIDLLQDRRYSLSQRMILLGMALRDLQSRVENGMTDCGDWAAACAAMGNAPETKAALEQMTGNREAALLNNIKLLFRMQSANPTMGTLIREMLEDLDVVVDLLEDVGGEMGIQQRDSLARYEDCLERFRRELGDLDWFFENLMVSVLFQLHYPRMNSVEDIWKSYVNFCNLYSLYRFTAVAACARETSRERLFHALVQVSRAIVHSEGRQTALQDELFINDSATLAHMAILVLG